MGIAEKFEKFCGRLTIDNRSTIATRCRAITLRLNKDFWSSESEVSHSFYTGSYGRGTAARGASDVDVIMELPAEVYHQYDKYAGNGQSALLQAVRTSIKKTYSSTDIGADGQVVVVSFTDGMVFEVVPGFLCKDGTYAYPDSNGGGRWRYTNPKPEISAIEDLNKVTAGNLVNLARMVRKWRDANGIRLGGLLVDILCFRFLADWQHKDKGFLYYDWMTRDFFEYLSKEDDTKAYWLAPGSNQQAHRKELISGSSPARRAPGGGAAASTRPLRPIKPARPSRRSHMLGPRSEGGSGGHPLVRAMRRGSRLKGIEAGADDFISKLHRVAR